MKAGRLLFTFALLTCYEFRRRIFSSSQGLAERLSLSCTNVLRRSDVEGRNEVRGEIDPSNFSDKFVPPI